MEEPQDTVEKNYKALLARYHFKDQLDHPLENCQDFIDLLDELEVLRKKSPAECASE